MKMKSLVLLFTILSFVGCVSKDHQAKKNSLTVMTYNVENLFDSLDDPGKDDETYLPIEVKKTARHRAKCQQASRDYYRKLCLEEDWSESKIKRKLTRLADVILQVRGGKGPDILILQEVENLNIAERLRLNYLTKAGYGPSILIEGPDKRGIDVAILSRLPIRKKSQLHKINLTFIDKETKKEVPARPTRGILQATFTLPGDKSLTVFGVHFPSQGNPTKARRTAIKKLNALKKALPKTEYVIAAGDFNISSKEDAKEGLFSKELASEWLVSHQIGCDTCEGTHAYRGGWSFLDAILFSKNFQSELWTVDPKSIRIPNKSLYQMNHWGAPARFGDGLSQKGVSDHWPLAADIMPKEVR